MSFLRPLQDLDLTLVIPVYNEDENVVALHAEITAVLKKLNRTVEVIYVDDGSRDKSVERLTEVASGDARVKVIVFQANRGQTAAMQAGISNARGRVIVPLDADLQNDPADIPRLLAKLDEGYDVVSGWRRHRKDKAITRRLPSIIANRMISKIAGVHLHDYGCSLKAYRQEMLANTTLYGEMHRFIPIYAAWEGARVTEIEVNHRPRVAGVSKYGLSRTFKVVLDLITLQFLFKYGTKPIYVFGKAAMVSLFISFGAFGYATYLKFWEQLTYIQTPLPLIAVMGFMLAVMFILMGVLAELMVRTYHEAQGKATYTIRSVIVQSTNEFELDALSAVTDPRVSSEV
ncbi:MAG: glycosyltransferase family 2 protein [Thermoleophilia bacterium]|nr:glycosyltransferase family 2 protein [Thermoleophilia bacterium]